ncbi:acyl-CoA dehydrogenase family protein [Roseibium sp.]|uniref:acyl-CoA dehydrogenase family protein n=1 Tax=Roseibium sp. TaxID=1936156 RepID=UPI003A97FD45
MNVAGPITAMSVVERARRAAAVASKHADDVDVQGRFPAEAVEAMKGERLLGMQIPTACGGEGASTAEIAEVCSILGQACAAAGMVFAMHQIKLSSLVSHGQDAEWHQGFMRRVANEQLLVASATTEGGIGGNLRNSICALEVADGVARLEKDATVISYGRQADAIMVTSRSNPDAAASDQMMTVFVKGQYTLDQTHVWDTMGMRGTCSDGFLFKGEAPAEQVLPKPFAEIAAQSMLANSHILWSAVWYGIAADAVARAQAFVRGAARRAPGTVPPGALRLAEVSSDLQLVKSNVLSALQQYDAAQRDEDKLSSMGFAVAMNNVKIASSQTILSIINQCLLICGILGYKNGTPFSLSRHLRDAHSAQLMISNDRILGNTSTMLLVNKQDTSLLG